MHEIEANECAAYRSLFEVGAALFGRASFEVREVEGATAFLSPLMRRPGVFNRVLGLGLERPLTTGLLRSLHDEYRGAGCTPSFELLPACLDAETCAALRAQQIRRVATCVQLVRTLDGGPVAPVTSGAREPVRPQVHAVRGPGCRVVAALCTEVFGLPAPVLAVLEALQDQPGWTHWVARVGGQPCGAALTYTSGDRCWFGWACTLPAWRGRGVKGALDDARIAAADDEGCRWISTDTGTGTPSAPDRSLQSLLHRGFTAAHLRASYLPAALAGLVGSRRA
jgi:GNAT superfamily N-acetyltransferase